MDKDIFTLIDSQKDIEKLWVDLGKAKSEIICKGKADALCRVQATFYNSKTESIECKFSSDEHLINGENYLGHFFLGSEKYYYQANASVHKLGMVIPQPTEVYRLQRRQNYRVRIPEKYPAFYNISSANGVEQTINGHLADLSSQGCRVIYRLDNPLIKLNDNVMGQLLIDERAPIEVRGVVRHIKVDEGNKVIQTFGIEFKPLSPILESKLFAIVMELHKELFKRRS